MLERNYRSRRGEIDVVALGQERWSSARSRRASGGRAGPGGAPRGDRPAKRRRLRLLAREWLSITARAAPEAETLRFDAIGVTVDRAGALLALEHVEGAF